MSRSYKKTPICCYKSRTFKKLFNRKIRRKAQKYHVFSHNYYKKMNDSWDICDWIFFSDWKEYWKNSNLQYNLWGCKYEKEPPKKKETYRKWYKWYKGK